MNTKKYDGEVILVADDTDEVACDGGGGALGHPKVWYTLDGWDRAECGYCDRIFIKESAASRVFRNTKNLAG